MFENVDGRTDDGRTTDDRVTGILIAYLRAFGSGELKNKKTVFMVTQSYLNVLKKSGIFFRFSGQKI